MTEPVGNSPRGTNIGSNAHRVRDTPQEAKKAPTPGTPAQGDPAAEQEEPTKIVTGKVISRKPPWYKRATQNMFAEDAGSIGEHIVNEIVYPGVRQLAYTVIVGIAGRAMFGAARTPMGMGIGQSIINGGVAGGPVSRIQTRYDQMAEGRPVGLTQQQRARHAFNEIVLADREEAIIVVSTLVERVVQYGSATVSNLYTMVGTTGSYIDHGWGWTDLSTADVKQVPGGWLLDLPSPVPLR